MSVKVMGEVWDLDIPHSEKFVLLAMADHAHDDGTHVYPSVRHICRKTSMSERAVRGVLKKLRERGLLIVQRKATRYTPTIYLIPVRGAKFAGLTESRGADAADPGVHLLHPESSSETSKAFREQNLENLKNLTSTLGRRCAS
jgi:Cdc6-related protein, AAA superfamily ATPase